ncbi:hypothetical protein C8Q76DRAFT_482521 [Earliella scabrosa]|nr:hypothetical protein C8Q76DRAFT_482521 [Earliella scabrosa]
MIEPIVFYDIPSYAKDKAWSPNTWKTRFCLNMKGLPYKTVWVEYPDIETLCKKIGATPTSTRRSRELLYSLPVIHDPNTKSVVSDSGAIARYLDRTYPDAPTLIPAEADALTAALGAALWTVFNPDEDLGAIIVPAAFAQLRERSRPYFRETREKWAGGKLEELAPAGSEKRAKCWETIRKGMNKIATAWLEADGKEKLFFMGDRVGITYADITIAGFLMWFKETLGEDSEEWKAMMTWDDGRWGRFMMAFEKYQVVDEGEDVQL